MSVHFIADLHLSEHTPARNMLLLKTLMQWMGNIEALYILGNLFDCWIGDDFRHQFSEEIAAALQAFSQHTPVFVQHGSHDFLLGEAFAERSGASFLPDMATIQTRDKTILLTHGNQFRANDDTDVAYQAWQQQALSVTWQQEFLSQTPPQRLSLVAEQAAFGLRPRQHLPHTTILKQLPDSQVPHIDAVVHAHTLEPGIFSHPWQGRTIERIALPAWQDSHAASVSLTDQGQWQVLPFGVK